MTKLPAFLFYPSDWLGDLGVRSLSFEEKGVWIDLLCFMHKSEQRGKLVLNGQPMTDREIAQMLNFKNVAKLLQTLGKLLSKGVASRDTSGALMNRRMVHDDNFRKMRAAAGSIGGKQKASKRLAKAIANSTPSVSYSSSIQRKENVKRKENFIPPTAEQAEEYAQSIGYALNGAAFVSHYAATEWMRGKNKIKNWKACVVTWKTKHEESINEKRTITIPTKRDPTLDEPFR